MDGPLRSMIDQTGLCVPLAARILEVIAESGASQMEVDTALSLVKHLRYHVKGSLVPEELAASWGSAVIDPFSKGDSGTP